MFIKALRPDGHEAVYECDRYVKHLGDSGETIIVMEGTGRNGSDSITMTIAQDEFVNVYVMNNNGRTIDTLVVNLPNRHIP